MTMTSKTNLAAGFDPGGKNGFGWCVAQVCPWRVIGRGVVSCSDGAFAQAHQIIKQDGGNLAAAGIDAPLTWARNGGERESDKVVKRWGTALAVNTLRGACLVQGFLIIKALVEKHPNCLITETNPKPLLNCSEAARASYNGVWDESQPDSYSRCHCIRLGSRRSAQQPPESLRA